MRVVRTIGVEARCPAVRYDIGPGKRWEVARLEWYKLFWWGIIGQGPAPVRDRKAPHRIARASQLSGLDLCENEELNKMAPLPASPSLAGPCGESLLDCSAS